MKIYPRLASSPFVAATAMLALVVAGAISLVAQSKRDISVTARKYNYRVEGGAAEIRVRQGDLVRITFSAEDIPHSFVIDAYRISRRAEPGKPVTFEFHADKADGFEIYCNLTGDDRCVREHKGRLVVDAK